MVSSLTGVEPKWTRYQVRPETSLTAAGHSCASTVNDPSGAAQPTPSDVKKAGVIHCQLRANWNTILRNLRQVCKLNINITGIISFVCPIPDKLICRIRGNRPRPCRPDERRQNVALVVQQDRRVERHGGRHAPARSSTPGPPPRSADNRPRCARACRRRPPVTLRRRHPPDTVPGSRRPARRRHRAAAQSRRPQASASGPAGSAQTSRHTVPAASR